MSKIGETGSSGVGLFCESSLSTWPYDYPLLQNTGQVYQVIL